MTQPIPPNTTAELEDLLALHLDALLTGSGDPITELSRTINPAITAELSALTQIAEQIQPALIAVEPNPEFVARLRQELVTPTAPTLILRWRTLPPTAKLAARIGGVTLGAGLMYLAGRGVFGMIAGLLNRGKSAPVTAAPALKQA